MPKRVEAYHGLFKNEGTERWRTERERSVENKTDQIFPVTLS